MIIVLNLFCCNTSKLLKEKFEIACISKYFNSLYHNFVYPVLPLKLVLSLGLTYFVLKTSACVSMKS